MYELKLHKSLTLEKWQKYPKERQMAMIANEINRLINTIESIQSTEVINETFERSFELIDLTIESQKKFLRKELLRWRCVFADFYLMNKDNLINSISELKKIFKVLLLLNPYTEQLII